MVEFIDQERESYGVEPICRVLPIAPSIYHRCKHLAVNPEQRCERVKRDEKLIVDIIRVYENNLKVYGARKIWKQLQREQLAVVRQALPHYHP